MATGPLFGTFSKIVRLRLRFQKNEKAKRRYEFFKRTKITHYSFHQLIYNSMPETHTLPSRNY